jgi:hypothetical protein
MKMRSLPCLGLCVALGAGTVVAQRVAVYDPTVAGGPGFIEMIPPTMLVPPGSPPLLMYPEVPPLPLPPPYMVPPGDSTFDGVTGIHYYTEGLTLASMPTPMFPPVGPLFPPVPIPNAVIGAIGGPVTGMAIDPGGMVAAPILWFVSGPGRVVGVAVNAALPIVRGPIPIPFPLLVPITGLEWDSLTGRLLANDAVGNVYPFFPGGIAAGPMIPGPAGLPFVAGDTVIDKTGMSNVWGLRGLYVLYGPVYADLTAPGAVKPVYPTGGSPNPTGMAYVPHPAAFPVNGVCPCPNFPMTQSITGPMSAGNAAFGITYGGLPPGQMVLVAFDFIYNPAFPFFNGIGCGLGLVFGSGTMVSAAIFASPAGVATYTLPLLVPAGTGPVFHQAGTFCPADPIGIVITPMYQIAASGL